MPIAFIYRKIVESREVLLPKLRLEVEDSFPNHQQRIDRTLSNFGIEGWKVIIMPIRPGAGGFDPDY